MKYLILLFFLSLIFVGGCVTQKVSEVEELQEGKLIVANPLDLSQIAKISKFRSCVGHDYSGLNSEREKETLRSMKHYIDPHTTLIGSKDAVKVFAPFDGRVSQVDTSYPGNQVFISAERSPSWQFVYFHIDPLSNIQKGVDVRAGQLIGYASEDIQVNFDFGIKKFGIRGQIFDSPFLHMSDEILEEYESHGITLNNIIITKVERDNNPCPTKGYANGDANFLSPDDDQFVEIN